MRKGKLVALLVLNLGPRVRTFNLFEHVKKKLKGLSHRLLVCVFRVLLIENCRTYPLETGSHDGRPAKLVPLVCVGGHRVHLPGQVVARRRGHREEGHHGCHTGREESHRERQRAPGSARADDKGLVSPLCPRCLGKGCQLHSLLARSYMPTLRMFTTDQNHAVVFDVWSGWSKQEMQ